MTANVFEESKMTLTAWIARGKGDRAKAKFEFEQEGGAETVEAAELELGGKEGDKKKVSTTITLPKCKDDEDFYTLSYKVDCDGNEYPGADFKVWLKTAKFKAVDSEGAALPGVPLTFNQTKDTIYVTDAKGECPLPINATAPAKVTVRSPCWLEEWTTEVGRLREAKVTKHEYQAVIVSPALEGNAADTPHRQYVNLPTDPDAPLQGSKIKIVLGGQTETECIAGIPEDSIYVKIEWDAAKVSKRNDPKRALLIAGETVEPSAKGVAEGEMKFDDKGEASFEVELGLAGGDAVKIHTGITKACEDSTLHVQNWRRVWYTLSTPAGETAPDLSAAAGALDEVFLEYIQHGETDEFAEGTGPAGKLTWVPADWFGGTAGETYCHIGYHNKAHFHGTFTADHSPLHVHVLCAKLIYDAREDPARRQDHVGFEVTPTATTKWSDATDVTGITLQGFRNLFPQKLLDGTNAFLEGEWYAKSDPTTKGPLAEGDTWIHDGKFTAKLPQAALDYLALDPANIVAIDFSLWTPRGQLNGLSAGHHQLLRIGRDDAGVCQTLCHELGHSVNQVPSPTGRPPGLTGQAHGRRYTGNGHRGGHCAEGMSDDNYAGGAGKAGTAYAGAFGGKSECTCVMYGEGSSTRKGKYCARCKPFFIAEAAQTVE